MSELTLLDAITEMLDDTAPQFNLLGAAAHAQLEQPCQRTEAGNPAASEPERLALRRSARHSGRTVTSSAEVVTVTSSDETSKGIVLSDVLADPSLQALHQRSGRNKNTEKTDVSQLNSTFAYWQQSLQSKKHPDGTDVGDQELQVLQRFLPGDMSTLATHEARVSHLYDRIRNDPQLACSAFCYFTACKCHCQNTRISQKLK
jgi:hypothetical protein